MSFAATDQQSNLFGAAPTLAYSGFGGGQDYGSSGLAGAPSAFSFSPTDRSPSPDVVGVGGGVTFDPNPPASTRGFVIKTPADVTNPSIPVSGGSYSGVALQPQTGSTGSGGGGGGGGGGSGGGSGSGNSTTTVADASSSDAFDKLIALASQLGGGGGAGSGSIVALPTGIADTSGSSSSGISGAAVAIVVAIVALVGYLFYKKRKAGKEKEKSE